MSKKLNDEGVEVYAENMAMVFHKEGWLQTAAVNLTERTYGGKTLEQFYVANGYILMSLGGIPTAVVDQLWDTVFATDIPYTQGIKWAGYFPHPAKMDPAKVAFYENDEKRKAGRLTVTKPGRFLRRCFTVDELSDTEVERIANKWVSCYKKHEVHILTCPDEIEEAYTARRFGSCMGYSAGSYAGSEHPVRVYGSTAKVQSDLAVAVIYDDGHEKGDFENIAARCVVWPERKIIGRIYGDVHKMRFALEAEGWTYGYGSGRPCDSFDGARIRRINDKNGRGIICPYLDLAEGVEVEDKHLVLAGDGVGCHQTNGLLKAGCRCEGCGECGDEDEMRVDDYGNQYCDDCYWERYRHCDVMGEDYPVDDFNRTLHGSILLHGITQDLQYLTISDEGVDRLEEQGKVFQCYHDDEWYSTRTHNSVTTENGYTYEMSNFDDLGGYCCDYSGEWHVEDALHIADGITVNADTTADAGDDYIEWLRDHGYSDDRYPEADQMDLELETAE